MTLMLITLLLLCAINYIIQAQLRHKKIVFYSAVLIQAIAYYCFFFADEAWQKSFILGITCIEIYGILILNIIENIRKRKR